MCGVPDAADTSETLFGGRSRAVPDVMDTPGDLPATQEKRCLAGDLNVGFTADKGIRKERS